MTDKKEAYEAFYGRKQGHISSTIKDFVNSEIPRYSIDESWIDSSNFIESCNKYKKVVLEIGFGHGDFIFKSALNNPDNLYIGAEVFINGVSSLLKNLKEQSLDNIKIFHGNIFDIIYKFPKGSLDNIYILFPDPWPKRKHNKRRIINDSNISTFHSLIKENGKLRFVSDHFDYVKWTLQHMLNNKAFMWDALSIEDFTTPPKDHFTTKYERKAVSQGIKISYLDFTRCDI